jgi:UrcA family protein
MRATLLAAATLFFINVSVANAHSAVADEAPSRTVAYRDLNLSSPEGVAALRRRVSQAVQLVCGDSDSRDLATVNAVHTCRSTAKAKSDPLVVAAIAQAGQRYAGASTLRVASR